MVSAVSSRSSVTTPDFLVDSLRRGMATRPKSRNPAVQVRAHLAAPLGPTCLVSG